MPRWPGGTAHRGAHNAKDPIERFWKHVEILDDGCWNWTASTTNRGYGVFGVGRRSNGKMGQMLAHRFSYEHHVETIPAERQIHHKCENKLCVNPEHMELATAREHNYKPNHVSHRERNKTHCPQNHPYSEANTYVSPQGWRKCRICSAASVRAHSLRKKNLTAS